VLFENPLGQKMLMWAAILMALGVIVIRRIVHVKI
jgi:Flp pilus assembly protein TadB